MDGAGFVEGSGGKPVGTWRQEPIKLTEERDAARRWIARVRRMTARGERATLGVYCCAMGVENQGVPCAVHGEAWGGDHGVTDLIAEMIAAHGLVSEARGVRAVFYAGAPGIVG